MPASRSRNTEWRRSLQQVMEKGGGLELAVARAGGKDENTADLVWRTKLTKIGDDFLEVERPQSLGHAIHLESGVNMVAAFVIGQNRFTFNTKVLGSVRAAAGARAVEMVRLAVPLSIERCQRRFDRFDLQGLKLPKVTMWPLLDPKSVIPAERANEIAFDALQRGEQPVASSETLMPEVGPPITATLMNIGGGGVGLRVTQAEAGALTRHRIFWMKIPMGTDSVPLVTTAKVVHTHLDSMQNTYAGVSFDFSFNPGHQGVVTAQITRQVQRVQAKQLPST